jgi:hypothetical protein
MELTYLSTYHALQTLKWSFTYIPTYSLIYLPCFLQTLQWSLPIYRPTYRLMYLPRFANPKMEREWYMSNLPWKICFGGFRNRRRSKTEGGRQKRKTEIIAHLRFVASFFWASSMKSLSRFLSLVVVAFFFYNWSSCSRSHFCSLIFKHRDGEFCFSVLVL